MKATSFTRALMLISLAVVHTPRAHALGEVQPPQINAPERGSIAGEYSHIAYGPADVNRGAFSLESPIDAPSERGAAQGGWQPVYSPGAGQSEWGMGWTQRLAITRFRVAGDLDYATDDLTGPWGRMTRGQDGYWYPSGLSSRVRVEQQNSVLIAYLPDGGRWTFGAPNQIAVSRGTYAWYLTEVQTAIGRKTHFTYVNNSWGRPFLSSVSYGGVGEDYQYQVQLQYEATPLPFISYVSGSELALDRRVTSVTVLAKNTATGQFAERWHDSLKYQSDGWGPAFYLIEVDKTFASGESAPSRRYDYQFAADHLGNAAFVHLPALDPVLRNFGDDIFQPNRSTALDIDNDGRIDLEEASSNQLLHQTDTGFVAQALPPPPAGSAPGCRLTPSPLNPPRHLAELRADTPDTQVVDIESSGVTSELFVCAREGTTLSHLTLVDDWSLGETTRLVDLNRDFQPDLIRVGFGAYWVLPNNSSNGSVSFGPVQTGTLSPPFTPTSAWVFDFNGDGLPDLIARDGTTLTVWFGEGDFQFHSMGQTFDLRDPSGVSVADLDNYTFTFLDANRDGLRDVLLVQGNDFFLFINNGFYFQQQNIPALASLDLGTSPPVFGDFSGTGNDALTVTRGGQALSLALDEPGTGLMSAADDGKGTVLRFSYGRAPAAIGEIHRPVVLSQLAVESSGYDPVTYGYQYDGPRNHSVGRFFLGFDQVTRQEPLAVRQQSFVNDDDVLGVALDATQADSLTPGVVAFESRQYSPSLFQGIRWLRPSSVRSGFQTADGNQRIEERTDILAYENEVCPSQIQHSSQAGTLTTQTTRASVAGLANSLHCLEDQVVRIGRHASSWLDFQEQQHVGRNDAGLATTVESGAAGGNLVLQTIQYNPDYTIASVASPGKGVITFGYDSATRLLNQISTPDGVVTTVQRAPVMDGAETLIVNRGAGSYARFFRFDGQERLFKSWDSFGQASEANPEQLLAYRYATATQPGAISVQALVDATTGSVHQAIELFGAGGEALTKTSRVPLGWAFDGVVTRNRSRAETTHSMRQSLAGSADPMGLDYVALLQGVQVVADARASSLGVNVDSLTSFHADVQRRVTTVLGISPSGLVETETENGVLSISKTLDGGNRMIAFRDQAGTLYGYHYDALGRLRSLDLPDGTGHRLYYDAHGRVARVERDGVASIDLAYDPSTGLPVSQTFKSPDGSLTRSVSWQYDAIGRRIVETHLDPTVGSGENFYFSYDGATPESPSTISTRGLLTAVSGDGFSKRFSYRADGKLLTKTVDFPGWRTITTSLDYAEAGAVRGETTTVAEAGALLFASTTRNAFDAFGRVAARTLNGQPFVSFSYDANDQPDSATFAHGETVTLSYDPLTRSNIGLAQASAAWSSLDAFKRNTRGFLDRETLGVGNQSVTRSYGYSPQGFLMSSVDANKTYGYDFDAFGLPTRIQEDQGSRTLSRNGSTLTAGTVVYQLDGLGRTIQKGDLQLAYGPDGQLALAQRGSQAWQFKYDEAGQRILKLANGSPMAAYLDEGYLDARGLTQPIQFGGATVGLIQNGAFKLIAADSRGTVLADLDGTARPASPFGDRAAHPDVSAAIDYVHKGYDPDLGLVRMGLRDYDPTISRFLTPDPLFLSDLSMCLKSPEQCALYGYAKNNPLSFADPTGTCSGDDCPSYLVDGGKLFLPTETKNSFVEWVPSAPKLSTETRQQAAEAVTRGKLLPVAISPDGTVTPGIFYANGVRALHGGPGYSLELTGDLGVGAGVRVLATRDGWSMSFSMSGGVSAGATVGEVANPKLEPGVRLFAEGGVTAKFLGVGFRELGRVSIAQDARNGDLVDLKTEISQRLSVPVGLVNINRDPRGGLLNGFSISYQPDQLDPDKRLGCDFGAMVRVGVEASALW